jgi:hypothetical protein
MSREYAFGLENSITSYSANIAPPGTKAFILKLGFLKADSGFFLAADNTITRATEESGTDPGRKTSKLQMYSVLIDHPHSGLILWEVGPGLDGWENEWGRYVPIGIDRANISRDDNFTTDRNLNRFSLIVKGLYRRQFTINEGTQLIGQLIYI